MTKIQIIQSSAELLAHTKALQLERKSIGLVPTMGYLHDGHLSLVHAAKKKCDVVILSNFVNPTQFGPNEDFDVYPRNAERDRILCEEAGVNVIFAPKVDELYPNGQNSTMVEVLGLSDLHCGASRPGHFRGVATVVSKLLNLSRANYAYFGKKDYQQFIVIKRMVQDLGLDVKILACPIVREQDGLAMSSRNVRLSKEGRAQAPVIYHALCEARAMFAAGARRKSDILGAVKRKLAAAPMLNLEFFSIVDPLNLQELPEELANEAIALFAGKIDGVRLIDNMRLDSDDSSMKLRAT
ncbi:MAG: pantoate--beta-alanine ligase [Bradymonadia bacterium]|jgi:pantoate--beta-alanine ligase